MNQQTVHDMYNQLIDQFNHARLVGDNNRVPLLRKIVAALDNPDQHYHVIHIAGTNGKGSTGAMISAILEAQGYRVGRFNSPAILNDREQIQFNHQWITEAEFIDSYNEIKPVVKRLGLATTAISIFEWQFLISLIWYRNQHADYVILEAGLGGLTDATNAISAPQLTVFTKIAMDHMQILGDTLTKIATQKAKITKPGTSVVTLYDQAPEAFNVLKKEAQRQDVSLTAPKTAATVLNRSFSGMTVDLHSELFRWSALKLNVAGDFQVQNLTLVLTAVAVLRTQNVRLTDDAVRTGLQQIQLPGRLTVVSKQPLVVVDVAHNPDGMTALTTSLKQLTEHYSLTWVVGFLADKAVTPMLQLLLPMADHVVTVTPDNPKRALLGSELAPQIKQLSPQTDVQAAADMPQALKTARRTLPENGMIVVTGSFYVARELAAMEVTHD
ncbi:bifunctional folylpolyglutamate synthase/dihydrofolate synthase [Secundilactobacillus yichangensis]|uniref:bifunctional folylpolyglutamate synthase/dihydrofolate synthase n=1 Tax=Secundilactobacillus yichangensis TaxID=2799580 RepID=UPI001943C263|nr:Mur ligase family protein [Secundilactobacillus yichangensis]